MNFQADSVQGVLFLAPGHAQDDALKLWDHLFPGDGPDGFQRAAASPMLNSSASGARGGFQTNVSAQVGRIDIILTQQPGGIAPQSGPPRIEDVSSAVYRVSSVLKSLAARYRVIRLAIVLELAKTVNQGEENRELLENLPGFPFPENSTDVAIQFNSRKQFECDASLAMNRLCAWNSGQVGFITTQPVQGHNMMIMTPYLGKKIDVNTVPELPVSAENIDNIIDEIASESLRIESEGFERFTA